MVFNPADPQQPACSQQDCTEVQGIRPSIGQPTYTAHLLCAGHGAGRSRDQEALSLLAAALRPSQALLGGAGPEGIVETGREGRPGTVLVFLFAYILIFICFVRNTFCSYNFSKILNFFPRRQGACSFAGDL